MAERSLTPINRDPAAIMEAVITKGDLAKLTPQERTEYYGEVCRSLGLNPLTKPFEYITLNGKMVLYALRTATDQLRKINGVSIEIVGREVVNGVYVVTAKAIDQRGRTDTEIGAVTLDGLRGDAYANALMKATTKAKRRVTLSICGLGWLSEDEVETIPNAQIGEPPTPIKTTVQLMGEAQGKEEAPAPLKVAKARLWSEAKRRGLSKELLNDYAQEQMGAALEELAIGAVADLCDRLKAEPDNDALLDRLTNAPGDDFVDVPMFGASDPDRFTN
jgi:hypothetical protein